MGILIIFASEKDKKPIKRNNYETNNNSLNDGNDDHRKFCT